jgi:2-polyprenyl-3-methyl-5-hydroxy-6-metoxy-1,4-benzoquinol methylase
MKVPSDEGSMVDESERQEWLKGLAQFDIDNQLAIMAVFCAFMVPRNLLDVGCGTGAVVQTAQTLGVDAFGVDQLAEDSNIFKKADLTQELKLNRKFDMVYCVEVVEHLQPEYEGVICYTLARHVAPKGILVFTAALPGQTGYNHFNCQPKKYWRDRLTSRGLIFNDAYTARMATIWKHTHMTLNHLALNVQVFNQQP